MVMRLKGAFARLLQRRTLASQFLLGTLNGLLPCGLVYIAAAGAATTLSPAFGALHMAAFGLGTLPMLFGVGMLGGRLRLLNPHTPKLIPIFVAAVAILLVVRGMALEIPYLSPALKAAAATACH
jgi:sulfite exporter TauE/SafE